MRDLATWRLAAEVHLPVVHWPVARVWMRSQPKHPRKIRNEGGFRRQMVSETPRVQ